MLDRELAAARPATRRRCRGYGTRATGHLQVAAAIAGGLADAGVASEPAALAYGLAFVPLAAERFDLVIPASQAGSREVHALRKVLTSPWLLDQLGTPARLRPGPLRGARRHACDRPGVSARTPGSASPGRWCGSAG